VMWNGPRATRHKYGVEQPLLRELAYLAYPRYFEPAFFPRSQKAISSINRLFGF